MKKQKRLGFIKRKVMRSEPTVRHNRGKQMPLIGDPCLGARTGRSGYMWGQKEGQRGGRRVKVVKIGTTKTL